MTKITIVNDQDEVVGSAEKKVARENGWIFRTARALVLS